jgi:hypothetical protein
MGTYCIFSPQIITEFVSEETKVRYLKFELRDPLNEFVFPIRQIIFEAQNPIYIQEWEKWLPKELGGCWFSSTEEWDMKIVPKKLRCLHGMIWEDYKFKTPRFLRYPIDCNGHKKGDVVCYSNGFVKEYNSISVLTKPRYKFCPCINRYGEFIYDEEGCIKQTIMRDEEGHALFDGYYNGWDLETVGKFASIPYIPISLLPKGYKRIRK